MTAEIPEFAQGPADDTTDLEDRALGIDAASIAALGDVTPDDNDLEDIRSELAAIVSVDTKTFPVEARPTYSVEFDLTKLGGKVIENIRKTSHDRAFADKIDGVKFASLIIAKSASNILRNGQPIPLPSGRPATFLETEFLDLFRQSTDRAAISAVIGVQRLYVLDGAIEATAKAVMSAAGWGDEAREADPTA